MQFINQFSLIPPIKIFFMNICTTVISFSSTKVDYLVWTSRNRRNLSGGKLYTRRSADEYWERTKCKQTWRTTQQLWYKDVDVNCYGLLMHRLTRTSVRDNKRSFNSLWIPAPKCSGFCEKTSNNRDNKIETPVPQILFKETRASQDPKKILKRKMNLNKSWSYCLSQCLRNHQMTMLVSKRNVLSSKPCCQSFVTFLA